MRERLLLVLVVVLLATAATAVLPAVAPNSGHAAGPITVVHTGDDPTPTPTPQHSNCQGGSGCGG